MAHNNSHFASSYRYIEYPHTYNVCNQCRTSAPVHQNYYYYTIRDGRYYYSRDEWTSLIATIQNDMNILSARIHELELYLDGIDARYIAPTIGNDVIEYKESLTSEPRLCNKFWVQEFNHRDCNVNYKANNKYKDTRSSPFKSHFEERQFDKRQCSVSSSFVPNVTFTRNSLQRARDSLYTPVNETLLSKDNRRQSPSSFILNNQSRRYESNHPIKRDDDFEFQKKASVRSMNTSLRSNIDTTHCKLDQPTKSINSKLKSETIFPNDHTKQSPSSLGSNNQSQRSSFNDPIKLDVDLEIPTTESIGSLVDQQTKSINSQSIQMTVDRESVNHAVNNCRAYELSQTLDSSKSSSRQIKSDIIEDKSSESSQKSEIGNVQKLDLQSSDYCSGLPSSIEPMSLKNKQGYCFFNSVIQILRSCTEFNESIIKYYFSSKSNQSTASNPENQFVNNFCQLFYHLMKKDQVNIDMALDKVQSYFYESRGGDDVNKCFMLILTLINGVTKRIGKIENSTNTEEDRFFLAKKNDNLGFVFDLFYGQMIHSSFCKICKTVQNKTFQLFKCLPLPVMLSRSSMKLSSCIDSFFEPSDIDVESVEKCGCPHGSREISSQSVITHAPKYLFIYLTRGSYYKDKPKNDTFVECDQIIEIPTIHSRVPYRLISVIDHIGDNVTGHYYCKCNYEGSRWTLISDEQISDLGSDFSGIISRQSIAFMFKIFGI